MIAQLKDGSLSKRFVFRWRRAGRYFETPIGRWPDVSLADARAKAAEFRAALARGENPATERRAKKDGRPSFLAGVLTFRQATIDYAESVGKGRWRTPGHAEDWLRGFRLYVWPVIGERAIADVSDAEAQAVLSPLFKRSPDLGQRIAARCKAVYDRARVLKATAHPNPFEFRGYLALVYPARPAVTHRRATKWGDIPSLYEALIARGDHPTALAARFMLALALRPNEARTARFEMIDLASDTLTLTMTKNGKAFVAPVNGAARAVVERCAELRVNDFLFPGRGPNKPINESAILELIRELTGGATAHGVSRSCFADWAYETGAATDSVIETALNHAVGNATTRAYKRGDLREARWVLMNRYSDFLLGANVITFPTSAADRGVSSSAS